MVKVTQKLELHFRPEEFSIQSATKRLDIFEEDRKRIMRSPWLHNDEDEKPQLVSKPGVFDFFSDWSDDILTDLNQLRTAVDQVLGIAPPIDPEAQFNTQLIPSVNNVESPNVNSLPEKIEESVNNISENVAVKIEPGVTTAAISTQVQLESKQLNSDTKKHNLMSPDQIKKESNENERKPEIKKELKKELSKEEVRIFEI